MIMSSKRLVLRNTVWNCGGVGVECAVGFLLAPYLIYRFGETTYGLWIIVGSLTSYFGLLDLGVRASVGRHIAFYRAAGKDDHVNEVLSTALTLLSGIGLVAFAGVAAVAMVFCQIYDVPAGQENSLRLALVLVGINLCLSLATSTFDAVLWGCQRFDLLAAVDSITALLRAGFTVYWVGNGGGLVSLALITLCATVLSGGVKGAMSFHTNSFLRVGRVYVTRRTRREIFGYGFWSFLTSVTRITRAQLAPLLIGALLGVALVTPYAIARRLVGCLETVLGAATGVLTPYATTVHASDNRERQQKLLKEGSKYCCILSLVLSLGTVLLGHSLIALWVGPGLLQAVPILVVLCLGELLPNTQYVARSMIYAAAEHRILAWLSLLELVAVVALTAWLVQLFGLLGAAVAAVLPGIYCRGIAPLVRACRLIELSVREALIGAFLPGLGYVIVPGLSLAAVVSWAPPTSWLQLTLYGGGFGLGSLLCCLTLLRESWVNRRWSQDSKIHRGSSAELTDRRRILPEPSASYKCD